MIKDYIESTHFYPITVICFLTFLISFFSVPFSIFIGILLSFWLTMRAKPDGLLGLMFLYFSKYYFFGLASNPEREKLFLGSFPLDVQTLMCMFIAIRVIWEIIMRPSTFRNKIPFSILILWLLAFIPVLIGFYLGFESRNPNWTRGLRWLMISGSYFYGFILLKYIPQESQSAGIKLLVATIIPISTVMLLLMSFNIFWSHHGFFFLGIGGAFSIYYIRKNVFLYFLLGLTLLITVLFFSLTNTITTMGIVLIGIIFSFVSSIKRTFLSPFSRKITW